MNIITKLLPNFCYSSSKIKHNGIVIHYFSGKYQFPDDPFNLEKCYDLFVDLNRPLAERTIYKDLGYDKKMYASAHYLIGRDGEIINLVPVEYKAWHAGKSEWNGKKYCNNWMIGIEMVATATSGYTDEQYLALDKLTEQLRAEYNIPWDNIVGHEDVAPGRKKDPGALFDWDRYRLLGEF